MSAIEPLCCLIGIDKRKLSKKESILIEADLFSRICDELKEVFRQQYKTYFCLMRFTLEMENTMLEEIFISSIIRDILSTGEYTLQGIARYTDTHEDVIQELASGINKQPLAILFRKIIELHRSVRFEIYNAIAKKIVLEYLEKNKMLINIT